MTDTRVYRVAVASPLRRLFDYLPPEAGEQCPTPGCRVSVPFGNRVVTGLVISEHNGSSLAPDKLKPIRAVIDSQPVLARGLLKLFTWASDYYQHPIGDALLSTLPVLLRRGLPAEQTETCWRLSHHGQGLPDSALRRAPRQQQLLARLRDGGAPTTAQLRQEGISRTTLKSLVDKGLAESFSRPMEMATGNGFDAGTGALLAEDHLPLYREQQQALASIDLHGFNTWLLQGETGSGKTEVYLQAIEKVLRYGRQALVLVPEISLTPQTISRFRRRFACPVVAVHSGLTDRERLDAWNAARSGRAAIVIGTRSAIFTPLSRPGIIIVDEEHDPSFKQQEGFRYSARDVAVMRARHEQIPLVLGSATPSLESLANGQRGRYRVLELHGRPGAAGTPGWQLLDIRHSRLNSGLSRPLIEAMQRELKSGNQVLVFLNRRGYAPTLICHDCGWIAECHYCDARLTVHQSRRALICHHCEQQQGLPSVCPKCRSPALQCLGQGTERCEDTLTALFPDIPVLRVDRDSTRRKQAMRELVDRVTSGAPCILVGTQMLAKGHHFPGVTLVAILDIDSGLFSPDFRATERMGQLITQVAGRAGRGDRPGTVILQSHYCEHPLIITLTRQGYPDFAHQLLVARKQLALPPFGHMAIFRAESSQADQALNMLQDLRQRAETLVSSEKVKSAMVPADQEPSFLGPLPAVMEKRGGRFRFQLTVQDCHRSRLQQLLTGLCQSLEEKPPPRQVRWSVDVDPQEVT